MAGLLRSRCHILLATPISLNFDHQLLMISQQFLCVSKAPLKRSVWSGSFDMKKKLLRCLRVPPPLQLPSLTFFCEPDLSVAPPSTCPILAYTVLHPCPLLAPTTTPSYGLALCVAPSSNCLMMSYSYTELLVATHVHFL